MAGKKIGELTPLGRNLISTDELELSLTGSAGSRKITGAQIIGAAGGVTSVTGTSPVVSSGGATPAISMPAATNSVNGYLTSTDRTAFNAKQAALVSGTNIKTVNGSDLLGSGNLSLPVRPYTPYITPGFSYTNTLTGGGLAGGFAQTINKEGSLTPFTPLTTFTVNSFSVLAASYSDLVGGVVGIYQSTNQQIGGTVSKVHQAILNLTASASIYTVSSSFTFQAGVTYWIGYFVYTVPSALGANLYVSDPRTMLPISSPVSLTQNIGYVINNASISSTLPNSLDLSTYSQSSLKQFQIWFTVQSIP